MQRSLLVFVLLVAPVAASSASAARAATAFILQSHRGPTDDQLGELKNANPEAFAIVNALLSKHSKLVKLAPDERGPDVFKRMMTPRHLAAAEPSVAVPFPDPEVAAAQPVIADQMHYSPNSAADKDESMVDRLLGAVAGLAGSKGKKIALLRQRRHHQEAEDPFAKDSAAFGMDSHPTPAPTLEQVKQAEAPEVKEQVAAAPHRENPYLKGIDLSGDMPEVVGAKHARNTALESHSNYLASFSFDDSAPAVEAPKPKVVAPKKKKDNVFLKWLSGVKKAPTPQEVAPAQPAKKAVNSYLANIDFLGQ